jgi:hypothetical protein
MPSEKQKRFWLNWLEKRNVLWIKEEDATGEHYHHNPEVEVAQDPD